MGLIEGEPPNFAVPICSLVVRLDLGTTNPPGGNRAARPVGSPLAVTLSGLSDTHVVWCTTVPFLRTQLGFGTSFCLSMRSWASGVRAHVWGPRAMAAPIAVSDHGSPNRAETLDAHCSCVATNGWKHIQGAGSINFLLLLWARL